MEIRRLENREELCGIINIQERVWGAEPVPVHRLLADMHNGGILLGAYDKNEMIGFQYSHPAYLRGEVFLWSNMTAVLPEVKNCGLGYQLKLRQRTEALRDGYALIAWTYDPLEALNAKLNIAKLGAVCSTYNENYYGELSDSLNANFPTDRLKVEWHIKQPPRRAPDTCSRLRVTIPADIQSLKKTAPTIALDWRLRTRRELQQAFARGYVISGFEDNGRSATTHAYLLCPRNELHLEDAPWNK